MCGIVGLLRSNILFRRDCSDVLMMRDSLIHRGPDASGIWSDADAGIVLGHRRLSILDLSDAGAQPMVSHSSRYVIVFNGELYNYKEIKDSLSDSFVWRGHSDTEVLLAAIEAWGVGIALKRSRGMFAFALWDIRERKLFLARDPIGEKPLYVAECAGSILFGSELKALMHYPSLDKGFDLDAVALALRHGFIPSPRTLFRSVCKIAPGEIVAISKDGLSPKHWSREKYFDALQVARDCRGNRFKGSPEEAVDIFQELLSKSVKRQMVADVPIGAFLSGGIDSSLITAVMQHQGSAPVETFTLGFHEQEMDEASFARPIAQYLGVRHNEIYLSGEDARSIIDKMPNVYDEPFADDSQLPTYLLAGFTRNRVTVSLTGDAGDELFGGYRRYESFRRRWNGSILGKYQKFFQKLYGMGLLKLITEPAIKIGCENLGAKNLRTYQLRLEERVARLGSESPIAAYEGGFSHIDQAHLLVPGASKASDSIIAEVAAQEGWSILEQISFLDILRYLPDDILVKVDRAAMAHSLETRIPLLDPDIVRFSFSIPDEIKLMNGEPKGILKSLLNRYVPRELWDRPKRGFGVPTASWLKGPLFEMASDLFSQDSLRRVGVLDKTYVNAYWEEFKEGTGRRSNIIWALFIIQLYLDRRLGEIRSL